ncbi:hypothetical protein D3C87_1676070 [compost metagenome]
MAPTEAPTTMSNRMLASTKARNIPTCTAPKLPPPANTIAVLVAMVEVSVQKCIESV